MSENFDWSKANANQVWGAVVHENNLVSNGFGANQADFDRSKSLLVAKMQTKLIDLIKRYENPTNPH